MTSNADIGKFGERLEEDQLLQIVQAKADRTAVLSAIREVSRRQSPRRLEVFQAVLADPTQDARARRTVATELGKERTPENQALLLQHLDVWDPTLFAKMAQSLGQIGDEQALEQLEALEAPEVAHALRAHTFAKSLLSYRLRLGSHLIKPPYKKDLVKVRDGVPFTAAAAEPALMQTAIREARPSVPAIPLAEDGAVQIQCGGEELLLAFAAEFREASALATLADQNAVPLVLLKKAYCPERYYLDEYFFTQPARGGLALLGLRPGGHLVYAGTIRDGEEGRTFSVRSVASRYAAAVDIEGYYDPATGSLTFSKTLASTTVAAREPAATPTKAAPAFG